MVGGKSVFGFLYRAACAGCWSYNRRQAPFPVCVFSVCPHEEQREQELAQEDFWMQQQRGGPAKRGEEKVIKQRKEQQGLD